MLNIKSKMTAYTFQDSVHPIYLLLHRIEERHGNDPENFAKINSMFEKIFRYNSRIFQCPRLIVKGFSRVTIKFKAFPRLETIKYVTFTYLNTAKTKQLLNHLIKTSLALQMRFQCSTTNLSHCEYLLIHHRFCNLN